MEIGGGYHAITVTAVSAGLSGRGAGIPIDVLGNGYAVGAPSVVAKGPYKIIHGSLDDLKSLPPLHVMSMSCGSQYRRESAINHCFA